MVVQTPVFSIRRHLARSPRTGQTAPFLVLETSDWVNVIARDGHGRVVMVEQYRHGTDSVTLEIPGGIIDPGEDAATAALRELAEESGYRPAPGATVKVIGSVQPNPAIQSNRCATVLVDPVLPGQASPDPLEDLAVHLVDEAALGQLVAEGVITHGLVVAALFHLHLHDAGSR